MYPFFVFPVGLSVSSVTTIACREIWAAFHFGDVIPFLLQWGFFGLTILHPLPLIGAGFPPLVG